MNEEKKAKFICHFTLSLNETLDMNTNNLHNLGYAALLNIYHELELNNFFINKFKI